MIEELNKLDTNSFLFNLFNVDINATPEHIFLKKQVKNAPWMKKTTSQKAFESNSNYKQEKLKNPKLKKFSLGPRQIYAMHKIKKFFIK